MSDSEECSTSDHNKNDEREKSNVKQEKSNVKQENKKKINVKENQTKRKLSDINPPQVRKTLHKMMSKYHHDPYYTPLDIAKKIIKKLRIHNTPYFMGRIKREMENWITNNVSDDDSDDDNSDDGVQTRLKGVLKQEKCKIPVTKPDEEMKESNVESMEAEFIEISNKLNNTSAKEKEIDVTPDTKSVHNSVKIEKEVPFIDLTVEVKREIKKEEIITIDDNSIEKSEKETNRITDSSTTSTVIITIDDNSIEKSDKGTNTITDSSTTSTVSGCLPIVPYPIPSNIPMFYPPECYQPYYPNYPNFNMYNPYFLPYSQYPYNPYRYNPSDFLPNYPIDHESENKETTVNEEPELKNANGSQTTTTN